MPRWCPEGLTKSQKRRVQRLRRAEQLQDLEERQTSKTTGQKVWRPKKKTDASAADVNMVFALPIEFMASATNSDDDQFESAQLSLDPMTAVFEKPEETKQRHLKALFLKGYVNGQPMTRLLVDGGAAVNIMPYALLRKIGKSNEDLAKTDMLLKDFEGNVSAARGALCVDLTIGSKTLPTTFFVVDGKGSYNMLLGRDWIHANCCIPSTLHQFVIQWVDDVVEVVHADATASIAMADTLQWSGEKYTCISGRYWDSDTLRMSDFEAQPIQAVGSNTSD